MDKSMIKITKKREAVISALFNDFPKSLVIKAATPNEGIDNPPITTAMILAIGINKTAGRKIIA